MLSVVAKWQHLQNGLRQVIYNMSQKLRAPGLHVRLLYRSDQPLAATNQMGLDLLNRF